MMDLQTSDTRHKSISCDFQHLGELYSHNEQDIDRVDATRTVSSVKLDVSRLKQSLKVLRLLFKGPASLVVLYS